MKIGLVLEGGGMRGIYTVGVLEALMENNIKFAYVIGVSAGAANGASYISEQRGRGYKVNTGYLKDKRYLSLSNFFKTKSIFGMDFIFNDIPRELEPFDYDTFAKSKIEFKIVCIDIESGKAKYFDKKEMNNDATVLKASAAIPMFSQPVAYKGGLYMDGGVIDSIPAKKALLDGCDKIVVVRTRDQSYRKTPEKMRSLYKRVLKQYPNLIKAVDKRYIQYNDAIEYIKELEKDGKAFVIGPSKPLKVSHFEKRKEKLDAIYSLGFNDTNNVIEELKVFMKEKISKDEKQTNR